MTERLRDADYVAERLGVPRRWVYRAARCGALPSVRCGRYRRFAERDIERWIEEQRSAAAHQQEGQHGR
jgi:excisionase family DNA binding protein